MDLGILRSDYNFEVTAGSSLLFGENSAFHQGEAFYWKDLTLQNAGYTYDYFSPYLLQDESISCENGLVQADGAGYQALIVYQEEMPQASAEVLLQWAKEGLPVVIVTGATEEKTRKDFVKHNRGGAVTTGSLDGNDLELAKTMEELKQQQSVVCVETQGRAYDALLELGVRPRAEFQQSNENLLTVLRKDGDASYLYVYNYMFEEKENYSGQLAVNGETNPYLIDTWNGNVNEMAEFSYQDGRTLLNIDLAPGEVAVFALDGSEKAEKTVTRKQNVDKFAVEDGKMVAYVPQSGTASLLYSDGTEEVYDHVDVPEKVDFEAWRLQVESWIPGEKLTRTEDKGKGYITSEITYDTKKTVIDTGKTGLVPWNDIKEIGETVSGVGTYSSSFTLEDDWDKQRHAVEFDVNSFGGSTAQILVNGQKVPVDMDTCTADLSDAVVPGENQIQVRVTSSLRNVMMANGYNAIGRWDRLHGDEYFPADYGMMGVAGLTAYTKVPVNGDIIPDPDDSSSNTGIGSSSASNTGSSGISASQPSTGEKLPVLWVSILSLAGVGCGLLLKKQKTKR